MSERYVQPVSQQLVEKKEKSKYVYKPKEKVWSPDIDYSKSLEAIQAQKTPAALYRHKLETVGRHARDMQRLEWRWSHDIALWTNCASLVKAGWRGMKGRIYFKTIRDALVIKKEQREARKAAEILYNSGKIYEAVDSISAVKNLTPDLQFMKSQFYYQLQDYQECVKSCRKGIDMVDVTAQGRYRYLLSCALAKEKKWEEAYVELSRLIALCDPIDDAYKLRAYIGFDRMKPPKYEQSLLDMFHLLAIYPNDLDLVLQRACIYIGLQDWDHAIEDFDYIIYYQPELDQVLAMRARAYSCRREWGKAKADYENILNRHPDDPIALAGIEAVDPPYEDLPMLDKSVVDT